LDFYFLCLHFITSDYTPAIKRSSSIGLIYKMMHTQSILFYILVCYSICLSYISAFDLDAAKEHNPFQIGETDSIIAGRRILEDELGCFDLKPCENTDGTKPTKVPCDCKDQRVPANKNCMIEDIVLEKCRGGT